MHHPTEVIFDACTRAHHELSWFARGKKTASESDGSSGPARECLSIVLKIVVVMFLIGVVFIVSVLVAVVVIIDCAWF